MILRIQPLDQVGGWWQIAEKPFRREDAFDKLLERCIRQRLPSEREIFRAAQVGKKQR
jgi:hypothetical protein